MLVRCSIRSVAAPWCWYSSATMKAISARSALALSRTKRPTAMISSLAFSRDGDHEAHVVHEVELGEVPEIVSSQRGKRVEKAPIDRLWGKAPKARQQTLPCRQVGWRVCTPVFRRGAPPGRRSAQGKTLR